MLLQGLAEVIIYQHFLLDRVQSAEVVRAEFLKSALTSPTIASVEDLYRQADILQLTLQAPQIVVLIELHGFEQSLRDTYRSLSEEERNLKIASAIEGINIHLRKGYRNLQDNLIAYFGDDRFVEPAVELLNRITRDIVLVEGCTHVFLAQIGNFHKIRRGCIVIIVCAPGTVRLAGMAKADALCGGYLTSNSPTNTSS